MYKKLTPLALIAVIAMAAFVACKKTGTNPSSTGSGFDRKGMLSNMSTNIIIPGYVAFHNSVITLDSSVTAFNGSPDVTKLTSLQTAFKIAYQKWQAVSVFDFGPAGTENLRISLNTFPADVTQINSNLSSGTYNLASLSTLAAQGLPAMDYLLFGTGANNSAILVQYTTDSQAANRKSYLAAVSALIKTHITNVLTAWQTSYPATFLNASGTDQGSSVGLLTNELNEDFEVLKNYEIGIPSGTESMGTIFPAKVQAYYSGISLQLALIHLQAIQNVYLGSSGLGFDDYLVEANAKYNGGSLNDVIKTQFATATAKLQALSDPLSAQITSNATGVNAAYSALQMQTVLLKTDMPSALGIAITYGDTDGD